MSSFTIRVYGILISQAEEVLVSTEVYKGKTFTKFPGGGLEFGEGTRDCLIREFQEECGVSITVKEHFHTTDFFVPSAFHENVQVINVYYFIGLSDTQMIPKKGTDNQLFKWIPLSQLLEKDVTFPTEKKVVRLLRLRFVP